MKKSIGSVSVTPSSAAVSRTASSPILSARLANASDPVVPVDLHDVALERPPVVGGVGVADAKRRAQDGFAAGLWIGGPGDVEGGVRNEVAGRP